MWLPTALNKGVWKTVSHNQWTTVSSVLDANATLAAFNKNLYIKYERVY
jgi:hypothetical protein